MQSSTDDFMAMADLFVQAARSREVAQIALATELAGEGLNYTGESLKVVDRYLTVLFKRHAFAQQMPGLDQTIVFGGAYVGEVIRRYALPFVYHWEDSRSYLQRHSQLERALGPGAYDDPCVRAMLVGEDDSMTMPVNKVRRFLAEGPENSVFYYASVQLQNVAKLARGVRLVPAPMVTYREFATGVIGDLVCRVGDVDFHGYDRDTGELIVAKDDYAAAVDPATGDWTAEFRTMAQTDPDQKTLSSELALAQRQVDAARGTPIVWRCAEKPVAELFNQAFTAAGLTGIRAKYYPCPGQDQ